MKPINIIQKAEDELSSSMAKINEMRKNSEEPIKSQFTLIFQDHIAYGIFLKELKLNIDNKIDINKSFFEKQIINIYKSCSIIKEMHLAYKDGAL